MGQFGICGHCKNEWYSVAPSGKLRLPKYIPTCPEGAIGAVCEMCFNILPSKEISALAVTAYNSGVEDSASLGIRMSATEHQLVASAIKGWVHYMKGESAEPPFKEEPLTI